MSKYKRLLEYGFMALFIVSICMVATHLYPQLPQKTEALPTPSPAPTQPALRQDAQVVAVMQRLGLDYSKLNLIYEQPPHQSADTEGLFHPPNTIYLTPSATLNTTDQVISHEYVHYVQYVVNPDGATSFYPYLEQLVTTDTWLNNRMEWHRDHFCSSGTCTINIDTEYEAVACTEMPDRALRTDFIAWCNTYLPRRYNLF